MTDQERVIDVSVEVPGTPEDVWQAIATGPGITSWFVPHEVDQREGGSVTMDFGSFGTDTAEVATWLPPHRVVFRSRGEHPLAYEWLVEAKDAGTCVVRLVNSGFGHGEEWDDQFDGMTEGWKIFLDNLRLHLTYFAGQRACTALPMGLVADPVDAAFAALCKTLGTTPELRQGDTFETTGADVPRLVGRIEAVHRAERAHDYMLLVDEPLPGHAFVAAEAQGEQTIVSLYLYLYGDDARAAAYGRNWAEFFTRTFPPHEKSSPEKSRDESATTP